MQLSNKNPSLDFACWWKSIWRLTKYIIDESVLIPDSVLSSMFGDANHRKSAIEWLEQVILPLFTLDNPFILAAMQKKCLWEPDVPAMVTKSFHVIDFNEFEKFISCAIDLQ